jgi:hypothetical protein
MSMSQYTKFKKQNTVKPVKQSLLNRTRKRFTIVTVKLQKKWKPHISLYENSVFYLSVHFFHHFH